MEVAVDGEDWGRNRNSQKMRRSLRLGSSLSRASRSPFRLSGLGMQIGVWTGEHERGGQGGLELFNQISGTVLNRRCHNSPGVLLPRRNHSPVGVSPWTHGWRATASSRRSIRLYGTAVFSARASLIRMLALRSSRDGKKSLFGPPSATLETRSTNFVWKNVVNTGIICYKERKDLPQTLRQSRDQNAHPIGFVARQCRALPYPPMLESLCPHHLAMPVEPINEIAESS